MKVLTDSEVEGDTFRFIGYPNAMLTQTEGQAYYSLLSDNVMQFKTGVEGGDQRGPVLDKDDYVVGVISTTNSNASWAQRITTEMGRRMESNGLLD